MAPGPAEEEAPVQNRDGGVLAANGGIGIRSATRQRHTSASCNNMAWLPAGPRTLRMLWGKWAAWVPTWYTAPTKHSIQDALWLARNSCSKKNRGQLLSVSSQSAFTQSGAGRKNRCATTVSCRAVRRPILICTTSCPCYPDKAHP